MATNGPFALTDTPLIRSRSLGQLLGFGSLGFKLESAQATGTWLDRDAVELVRAAVGDGLTGLCLVGSDALALPLAMQCARAGLRFVVLTAVAGGDEDSRAVPAPADSGDIQHWLMALGAVQIDVAASPAELLASAPRIAATSVLRLVEPPATSLTAGLAAISAELADAGSEESMLAVPDISGREYTILSTVVGERTHALQLPLTGPEGASSGRAAPLLGVVGRVATAARPAAVHLDSARAASESVLACSVSLREADAARALLAREEGLLVSHVGACGLAALIRAVRDDRARRPREQRLPRRPAAIVVLTGAPAGGEIVTPRALELIERPTVALADLEAAPARWLLRSPAPAEVAPESS